MVPPKVRITTIAAMAMSPAIKAYSMAVAPEEFLIKFLIFLNISYNPFLILYSYDKGRWRFKFHPHAQAVYLESAIKKVNFFLRKSTFFTVKKDPPLTENLTKEGGWH
jgi:hypothetical protein